MKNFYSNGKILLSGEYLVYYGAKAIGLPIKMGQNLIVTDRDDKLIDWTSYNNDKKIWFKCILNESFKVINTNENSVAKRLQIIIKEIRRLNPKFIITGKTIKTHLNFDYNWGLGSSSTLINNLSNWAKVNPYSLLKNTFGGSGYDIACASNNCPILFSKKNNNQLIKKVNFNPKFKENLFFIYLNNSQNSQKSLIDFKKIKLNKTEVIDEISKISADLLVCTSMNEFSELINMHEKIIGKLLKIKPLIDTFPDYTGSVKSLGAWGGDFFLAIGPKNSLKYFENKGFKIGFTFDEFILQN